MKRATGTSRRRRSAVALNLALVMAAGSVVGYAVSARGYDAHKPDLNDGGVWVTDSRLSSFGRINKPIGQLDAIVYSDDRSDVDILQQDSAVVGVNFTTRRLSVIDPTTGTPAEGREASLPRASEVQLAGGTIATLDPVKGSVWATRVAPEGALPDLSRIRFHDLRHSAASFLAAQGASLLQIAQVLGHKQITQTARYSHLVEHHKAAAIRSMVKKRGL